jgi:hypothetical protein
MDGAAARVTPGGVGVGSLMTASSGSGRDGIGVALAPSGRTLIHGGDAQKGDQGAPALVQGGQLGADGVGVEGLDHGQRI